MDVFSCSFPYWSARLMPVSHRLGISLYMAHGQRKKRDYQICFTMILLPCFYCLSTYSIVLLDIRFAQICRLNPILRSKMLNKTSNDTLTHTNKRICHSFNLYIFSCFWYDLAEAYYKINLVLWSSVVATHHSVSSSASMAMARIYQMVSSSNFSQLKNADENEVLACWLYNRKHQLAGSVWVLGVGIGGRDSNFRPLANQRVIALHSL